MAKGMLNVRYENLLKPLQENLLKNWTLTMTLLLDDYLSRHGEEVELNFSEAAIVVQNSSSFYCRRVDVLHSITQELVEMVCHLRASSNNNNSEDGSVEPNKVKKKKVVKSLELDDLQLLDFVATDSKVDGDVDHFAFRGAQKLTVLNSSVSTLKKNGCSITTYQSNGKVLGYKEEFKVFGKCYSDGTVNVDFEFNTDKNVDCIEECEDMDVEDDLRDADDWRDENEPELIAEMPSIIPEPEPSSLQIPSMCTLPSSPTLPTGELTVPLKKSKPKKNLSWETIPVGYKAPLRVLKVGNVMKFPLELKDAVDVITLVASRKLVRRKRKRPVDDKIEAVCAIRIVWLDLAIRSGSTNEIEMKLIFEQEKRKLMALHSVSTQMEELDQEVEADDDPNDFENFMDDTHDPPPAFTRVDEIINNDDGTDYSNEAFTAIERFKEKRRENIFRETEIAKRVAEWHKSIMPVLEISETRSQFNVHDYGTRILQKFPDNDLKTWHSFSEIVTNQPKIEICRYFLSTLMLSNTYNLEIRKSADGPLVKDCVELKLLSKVRHHEEMDEAMRMTVEDCPSQQV